MSTDTAFALGLLALVGPRFPQRLRAFLLTIAVVDDVLALLVIATVYTEEVDDVGAADWPPCCSRRAPRAGGGVRYGVVYVRRWERRSGWRCSSRASTRWSSAS